MTQQSQFKNMSGRELAKARRQAMSASGKQGAAQSTTTPTRARNGSATATATSAPTPAPEPVATPAPAPTRSAPTRSNPARRTRRSAAPVSADNSTRAAALARRKALSSRGKPAARSADRVRDGKMQTKPAPASTESDSKKAGGCGCGCKKGREKSRRSQTRPSTASAPAPARSKRSGERKNRKTKVSMNPGRAASVARRRAQSTRGKAGLSAAGMTQAQTVRSANPEISSRELARALREQRSKRGSAGQKKTTRTGRIRPSRKAADNAVKEAAKDQPWKVGAGETSHGQFVTGTMVGRSEDMTGDEASTCRAITGTEYMGADIFRDFCQTDTSPKAVLRTGISATSNDNAVTGNRVGRSSSVTGDEAGTCKLVTGTEYVGAEQNQAYCNTQSTANPAKVSRGETHKGQSVTGNLVLRSDQVTGNETGANRSLTGTPYTQLAEDTAPQKVGTSKTLRGGEVTGTMVGRQAKMTGDEFGSCRNITGDDYVGMEQYGNFCLSTPNRADNKVQVSSTLHGETITGSINGRSSRVTGDEPGTCKAVTGTPYAGTEQYNVFCERPDVELAAARMHKPMQGRGAAAGAAMTGIQPGLGGKMTGDEKGACETVSGTPYVGADQQGAACPSMPSDTNSSDFPQVLGTPPWKNFSTTPPNHAMMSATGEAGVTGTGYEQGQITGPFDMAPGKVTGTETARFGHFNKTPAVPAAQPDIDGRVKSRVTGEGMDAGAKVTGDDWGRGDHVTGTEGMTAQLRNPTRQGGPMTAMAQLRMNSRNEDLPTPISKVTGSSGNTDQGSLITYSGGARG